MVFKSLPIVSFAFAALVLPPAEGVDLQDATCATKGIHEKAKDLWETYVQETTNKYEQNEGPGIQSGCEPRMYEPENHVDFQGTIMLLHGFTACPQQFELIIPMLTSSGFAVLVPLLPGQGANFKINGEVARAWTPILPFKSKTEDFIDFLPTAGGTPTEGVSEYAVFGERMNLIMDAAAASGDTVVFGVSLGGGIATYMSLQREYTRRLLVVPFAGFPWPGRLMTSALIRDWARRSFGEGCEEDQRGVGRAGICQFPAAAMNAIGHFGEEIWRTSSRSETSRSEGATQIIFVEDDPAVSTPKILELSGKLGLSETSESVCGFPNVVGHSFFSKYDNPKQNKFWLKEVINNMVQYLVGGVNLPQKGKAEKSWPGCALACTADRCPWTFPPDVHGKLTVEAIEADDLEDSDTWSVSDPFMDLRMDFSGEDYTKVTQQERRSRTVQNKLNPKWEDEKFEFDMSWRRTKLILTVMDEDTVKDDKLGMARVDLREVVDNPGVSKVYKLDLDRQGTLSVKLTFVAV